MHQIHEEFRQFIASNGMEPPAEIIADGKVHRFSTNGKRSDAAGWYCLHLDGLPAGIFGDWRQGLTVTWCSKQSSEMTQDEREANRQRMRQIRQQRDAEQAEAQAQAAHEAAQQWEAAIPASTEHGYLSRKGVQPHGLKVNGDGLLLVPLRDTQGKLHSLQTIAPDGTKRFLKDGRVQGCYHAIGKPADAIVVCEGYATGASIHEATGAAVAVSFNAGNLLPVARAIRAKYPGMALLVAADDDYRTPGNPGMDQARHAANAVQGTVAVPEFGADRPEGATDFNDLHQAQGPDAVKRCIDAAMGMQVQEWDDPQPLPSLLPPVQAFDLDLLPEAFRGWVQDIAHRLQQPPDFAAAGAIVALSGLIGARVVIKPKRRDDWQVVPNLWGLLVGRPGTMKSPTLSQVMKPLDRLEIAQRKAWEAAREAWERDCRVAELQEAANEKLAAKIANEDAARARELLEPMERPPEPKRRRFITNDATMEKLGELMRENPWGMLAYRDELHGLIAGMERAGQEGARTFYLQAHDGNQGYTFDRIGRGEVHIPRVCLAMLGTIQPAKLHAYVRGATSGGAGDDGLLQRFGVSVWPDPPEKFEIIDEHPNSEAMKAAWAVFERLAELQPEDDDPITWRFDDEAQALFFEWYGAIERELRGGELHPAMESHLSKYRKLIPALALLFALVDTPESGQLVGATEVARAVAWGEYLRSHAERIYSASIRGESGAAHALLEKIKLGKVAATFKVKDVQQNGWTWLNTTEEVKQATDMLEAYGWIRLNTTQSGDAMGRGRPAETYSVHPRIARA